MTHQLRLWYKKGRDIWHMPCIQFTAVVLVCLSILSYRIGVIPQGLFTDEAVIGLKAYSLLQSPEPVTLDLFFYDHHGYVLGALPLYATAPFVKVLGMSDFSVRFASIFYASLFLGMVHLIGVQLRLRLGFLSVILLLATPIFFHISRVNFGMTPSLFLCAVGYYGYLRSMQPTTSGKLSIAAVISGLSSGLAMYGHGSFMIFIPLVIVSLWVPHVLDSLKNRAVDVQKRIPLILLTGVFMVFLLPTVYQLSTNQNFMKRFSEKGVQADPSVVQQLINAYPKYYDYNWWLVKGETGMSDTGVLRHSVRGNGEMYVHSIFILTLGIIFVLKDRARHFLLAPMILLLFLFPIPDALTSRPKAPAYALSVYPVLFSFGILYVCGMDQLSQIILRICKKKRVAYLWLMGIVISASIFITGAEIARFARNYAAYPKEASGYWGWQWGYADIMNYYLSQSDGYDELYLHTNANAPSVFLSFYDPGNNCKVCLMGGIDKLDVTKRQLFSLSPDDSKTARITMPDVSFTIQKELHYPDGTTAFYIVEPYEKTAQ